MDMKKLFLVVPLLILAFAAFLIYKNQSPSSSKTLGDSTVATPIESTNSSVNINYKGQNFTIGWFQINNMDNLKLFPNFAEKVSSRDILGDYECQMMSNASYYTEDNKPIGLFISNGKILSKWQKNSLLDGVLSINDLNTPRITRTEPEDHLVNAVQAGPILKENNMYEKLNITSDKDSRRIFAAVTGDNSLYFLTAYNPNSQYSGPYLADMPNILKLFEDKTKITFADAINLDGGAASTYFNGDINLSEVSPVGAFFCQF
jgi:exopolysaccharide biosynthesis protein